MPWAIAGRVLPSRRTETKQLYRLRMFSNSQDLSLCYPAFGAQTCQKNPILPLIEKKEIREEILLTGRYAMSEMPLRNSTRSHEVEIGRMTLAHWFAEHVKETRAWFDELSRKTGYRYPITY